MPSGTVITRLRSPASMTTYAVITLVTLPIGRSLTDERLHRSAPVAAFASSAHGARTPAGAAAVTAFAAVTVFAVGTALAAGAAAVSPAASRPVTAAPLSSPAGTRIGSPTRFTDEDIRILSAARRIRNLLRDFSSERSRGWSGPCPVILFGCRTGACGVSLLGMAGMGSEWCPACGYSVEPGTSFCSSCGEAVPGSMAGPHPVTAPSQGMPGPQSPGPQPPGMQPPGTPYRGAPPPPQFGSAPPPTAETRLPWPPPPGSEPPASLPPSGQLPPGPRHPGPPPPGQQHPGAQ